MMQAPDSVRMRKSSVRGWYSRPIIYASNSMLMHKSSVGIRLLGIGLACLAATQLSGSYKNANRRKPSAVLFGIGAPPASRHAA